MGDDASVSAMLSRALVAFTIEFDNEFEHRMPHVTTDTRSAVRPRGAPWLVSQPMWVNAIQHVPAEGIPVRELHRRARTTHLNLPGLVRWRYITVSDPPDPVVQLTTSGRQAAVVWRPLAGEVEDHWRQGHGEAAVSTIKAALTVIVDRSRLALPSYLPITSPTENGRAEPASPAPEPDGERDLSVLLAQSLQLFALDVEASSRISLPIGANLLRVLGSEPIRLRDLPGLSGIARPGIDMALGFLKRRECVAIGPDPHASRGKVATLTTEGAKAQTTYRSALAAAERRWSERYGDSVPVLRQALTDLAVEAPAPYPDGWRAAVTPLRLPDFPMVLHRGGYPDGS